MIKDWQWGNFHNLFRIHYGPKMPEKVSNRSCSCQAPIPMKSLYQVVSIVLPTDFACNTSRRVELPGHNFLFPSFWRFMSQKWNNWFKYCLFYILWFVVLWTLVTSMCVFVFMCQKFSCKVIKVFLLCFSLKDVFWCSSNSLIPCVLTACLLTETRFPKRD